MQDAELAYAAGFFDGEGCVQITKQHPTHGIYVKDRYSLVVIVGQRHREPLDWLQTRWGGRVRPRKAYGRSRASFTWTLCARQARQFLQDILPWLQVKHGQAAVGVMFQSARTGHGVRPSIADIDAYEACRREIVRLNDAQQF